MLGQEIRESSAKIAAARLLGLGCGSATLELKSCDVGAGAAEVYFVYEFPAEKLGPSSRTGIGLRALLL